MSRGKVDLWMDLLGGQNSQHIDRLRQDQKLVEMSQASNVIPDPVGKLVTSPGFSKVRATAISGAPAITGMFHLGDRTDEFLLTSSDGEINRDNANPPAALAGGTDFTSGASVLTRFAMGGSSASGAEIVAIVSSSRDVPQAVTVSTMGKANLAGTPPRGVDVKVFGRRPWMFGPSDGTDVYRSLACFGSTDDSMTAWTNPFTTNFLNFGRPGQQMNVLGGEIYKDFLMTFTEDQVFPVYQTPAATLPFSFQAPIFSEEGGGPPVIHSVVPANDRIYWISKNFDVKMLEGGVVKSIGYAIQPFLRGLKDSARGQCVGGWEPQYRMVIWSVTDGSDTQNNDAVMLQVDTGQFYFRTISRNAYAIRRVSGELRLIGGGYAGLFYNEFDSSTTGDLDNSASAIDADVMTPRHHLGMPHVTKKVPYFCAEFDPISTEAITVQYQINDDQSWTSFPESPYTVVGTDVDPAYFTIPQPFERIRLRFRDANSGQRFRVLRYGFPSPRALKVSR